MCTFSVGFTGRSAAVSFVILHADHFLLEVPVCCQGLVLKNWNVLFFYGKFLSWCPEKIFGFAYRRRLSLVLHISPAVIWVRIEKSIVCIKNHFLNVSFLHSKRLKWGNVLTLKVLSCDTSAPSAVDDYMHDCVPWWPRGRTQYGDKNTEQPSPPHTPTCMSRRLCSSSGDSQGRWRLVGRGKGGHSSGFARRRKTGWVGWVVEPSFRARLVWVPERKGPRDQLRAGDFKTNTAAQLGLY